MFCNQDGADTAKLTNMILAGLGEMKFSLNRWGVHPWWSWGCEQSGWFWV